MFSAKLISVWVAGALAVAAAAFLPVTYTYVIERGTDSFEAHQPLFEDQVVNQDLTLIRPTKALGVIAVNLRHVEELAPLQVRVLDSAGEELAAITLPSSEFRDDHFTWVYLPTALLPQDVTLELTASQATDNTAVGVRLQQATGNVALSIQEQVPLWQRVILWRADNPDDVEFVDRTLIASALIGVMLVFTARFGKNRWVWVGLLAVLAIGTVLLHLPLARSVEGVFGGDAFNFLLKARAWLVGADPFTADPRKAPFFSVLLFPAYLGLDAVWWGRIVNMASAGLAASITAALAARLGLPRTIALSAGLLVAVNRELWWESVHGLSNVPYTALIVIGTYMLVSKPASRRPFRVAVTTGLAFLTRYEGALVAAVLLPAVWIRERLGYKRAVRMLVVAAIIAAIPFIMWPLTGKLGVRTAEDVVDDPGLYIAWSADDYMNNLERFELFWGRLWLLVPLVGWQLVWFGIGVAAGVLFLLQKKPAWLVLAVCIAIGGLLAGQAIGGAISHDREVRKQLSQALTFVIGIGVSWLVIKRPKWIVPTLIMLLLQIAFVAAILPKTRYFIQVIPFAALALAAGVYVIGASWRKGFVMALLALLIGVSYADAARHLPGQASRYNTNGQEATVVIKAGRFLKGQSGNVAVGAHDLPLRAAYVPDEQLFTYPPERSIEADDIIAWLNENHISRILEISPRPLYIQAIEAHPELFERTNEFDTKFGEAKAWIYAYHPM